MIPPERVAVRPAAAQELVAAFRRAREEARAVRDEVAAALAEAGEEAPAMERALTAAALWSGAAADALAWRIAALEALDATWSTPHTRLTATLPTSRHDALHQVAVTVAARLRHTRTYEGMAAALAAVAAQADDPTFARTLLTELGTDLVPLLERIVDHQRAWNAARLNGSGTAWRTRDVRADLLAPLAAAFRTAARSDGVTAGTLTGLMSGDRVATGTLLLGLDVAGTAVPHVQAALWSVPLGYDGWPQVMRELLAVWATPDPHTGALVDPALADRIAGLRIEALDGLAAHPAAAWQALTTGPGLTRVLEECRRYGEADRAGLVLEAGFLRHPQAQGWTADVPAATAAHPEWATNLTHVIRHVADGGPVPAAASDSLAALLAPHIDEVAAIARSDRSEQYLTFAGQPGWAPTHLRNYLARILEHDEGSATFRDLFVLYSSASLAEHARTIHGGGDPDRGAAFANVSAVFGLTLDAVDRAGANWERQQALWLEVPQTFENITELATLNRLGAPAFTTGEILSRAVRYPSDLLDRTIRNNAPSDRTAFTADVNALLQRHNLELLLHSLDALPEAQRRELLPAPLPDPLIARRTEDRPLWLPDVEYTEPVDRVSQWDPESINRWLMDNARGSSDPQNYWLIREVDAFTASMNDIQIDRRDDITAPRPEYMP